MAYLSVLPAFEEKNLTITLQTSEFFVPYASVTMLSIIEHTSLEYNYDFLIFSWDMSVKNAQKLVSMAEGRKNISIRIIDISEELEPYLNIAKKRADFERFSAAGIVRLLLPELLKNYDTVLNFDCDMLVCTDISELFQYDLTEYYMGAVRDILCYIGFHMPTETYFTKEYVFNKLKLNSMAEYCNGGLLLLNIKKIRDDFSTEEIMNFAISSGEFLKIYEQDTFNSLFREKKLFLPMEWNWQIDTILRVQEWETQLSINDTIITEYHNAEKKAKIYHFLTNCKPWNDTSILYADKWWIIARKSPFFKILLLKTKEGQIVHKATSVLEERSRYLLFFCETAYQLLNILNIKFHYYTDVPSDLILCKTTDLSNYKEKIKNLGLFHRVILSEYDGKSDTKKILDIPVDVRTCHPEQYEYAISFPEAYTDYFLPVSQFPYPQMLYYQIVKKGKVPSVYIFEEGASTYTDNLYVKTGEYMNHQLYPENQRLPQNVAGIFLYRPDLYCGISKVPKLKIPSISVDDIGFSNLLNRIFGEFDMPEGKYLFFNESFSSEGMLSNDIEILDTIAEITGRENIVVKIHPRSLNMEALYRLHGYQIFSDKNIPWEMAVLSPQLEKKILLSISSNAIWTPLIIAEKRVNSISLLNIMKLSRRKHVRSREYQEFMHKIQSYANKEENTFYIPDTLLELKNIIYYMEGKYNECNS